MLKEEHFPEEFRNTTLHMLFKGKGKPENLSDNRFIHSKPWFPRLVESLVVEGGLRTALVGGSSMYQIGGQAGHRSEELVFALKSVIARNRQQGKMTIVQTYDISKFFDKEMMEDAVLTCISRGADPKAVRLWHRLNDDTRIRVRTGGGMT